jgi:hypothetical protein
VRPSFYAHFFTSCKLAGVGGSHQLHTPESRK